MHVNAEHRGAFTTKACLAVLLTTAVAAAGVGLAAMQGTSSTTQAYAEDEATTDATASPVPLVYSLEPSTVSVTLEGATSIGTITPDAVFAFEATEDAASSYSNWVGDWVVTFDVEDSSIESFDVALIGQYDEFSKTYWFPALFSNVQSGTECHLMEYVYTLLGGGYLGITYDELCKDVDVFTCGAVQNVTSDDTLLSTALNAKGYNVDIPEGTTMTVELRLYDPDGMQYSGSGTSKTVSSYGNYVTIGSYTYTFGSDDE